jgi:hypothetical protein
MNTIQLQNDGAIIDERHRVVAEPLAYLSNKVELADAFSLRSFFRMIAYYDVLAKINAFFPSYLDQCRACPADGCCGAGFDFLEFSKTVEMIGFPGEPRLEIYHSLNGVCGTDTSEIKSSRLEGLLDLQLRLGKLKHVVFGDRMDVFEFETVFTLFEFIDGIAWELSFHGTPDACDLRR